MYLLCLNVVQGQLQIALCLFAAIVQIRQLVAVAAHLNVSHLDQSYASPGRGVPAIGMHAI